jgi:formate/nitrite transporter
MPENKESMTNRRFDPTLYDAYTPAQIAKRFETVGVSKATMAVVPLLGLSLLAGAFISFGAMFYTLVMTGSGLGLGIGRLLGGLSFCLGLILVVVGGAELFTSNVLIVIGWANRRVNTASLLRNWVLVYAGNLLGALGMVVLAYLSDVLHLGGAALAVTAVKIAAAKVSLPFEVALVRGVLCNILVCLAVWLCFAGRSVVDKILAIIFPITAFVALGFEHSIANMFFIPIGIVAALDPTFAQAASAAGVATADLDLGGLIANLVPVTIGNVLGGGVFVALTYYVIYLHGKD